MMIIINYNKEGYRIRTILSVFIVFIILSDSTYSQWLHVATGIENKTIYSLFTNGSNIFAGTYNNGLYMSTDNGSSWTLAGTGIFGRIVFSLTYFGGYLYAGTDIGVFRSSNNGAYWSGPSLNSNAVYSLGSNQSRVFAGLHNSGLFYSSGGTNWMISSLNATNIKAIAVDGDFIAAGSGNNSGVFISTNNGANWISTTLNNRSVYSLAKSGNYIFAGTGSGVYCSTDLGTTWNHSTLNNDLVYSLAVTGNSIFAGTELSGVFVSSDNGVTWAQRNEGLGNAMVYALSIFNNYLYAGVSANGVYKRFIGELVEVNPVSGEGPKQYSLSQNYPNPFNPNTKISFSLPKQGYVKLVVFDILGKEVASLVNKQLKPGTYEVDWNASSYPSGAYFYILRVSDASYSRSAGFAETKKMMLVK